MSSSTRHFRLSKPTGAGHIRPLSAESGARFGECWFVFGAALERSDQRNDGAHPHGPLLRSKNTLATPADVVDVPAEVGIHPEYNLSPVGRLLLDREKNENRERHHENRRKKSLRR